MRTDENTFYSDFDYETVIPRKKISADYRNPFQVDRDRIIYSSAFRRLQSKTQVFLSGEYDFYRTRLTHSLEVAQIAKSIVQYLTKTSPVLNDQFYIDLDLIEAVALTHDIGHPPFGHTGEKILQEIMEQKRGGFEGNAQSLRIISNLIYSSDSGRMGMAPTRAFLDGILKYKVLFSEKENTRGKYLLDNQDDLLAFVYKCENENIPVFEKRSRSIECQIMEWADNSAYSINDLLDGYKAGFISKEKIEKWRNETVFSLNREDDLKLTDLQDNLVSEWQFEKFMARQIGKFIQEVSIVRTDKFMSDLSNRYAYNLLVNQEMENTYRLYKQIAIELIFNHPSVQQLEFKGKQIIRKIFEALENEYIEKKSPHIILPPLVHFQLMNEENTVNKYRIICDHIAGMSDAFVIKTYKRLFDPDFGSIVDLV